MALLEIHNVTRRFGEFTAVDGVSIDIEAGEFFTLLGPSGCGKTTLLRMIAGFDLPDGGRIMLNGHDLADQPPEGRPVRTVFQSYALFPHMTVEGNIAFPLQMAKTPAAAIPGKIAGGARGCTPDRLRQALPARAFRRPEATGRHRTRAGHPSDGAAARRAAGRTRREVARGNADRTDQFAEGSRHHLRVRDSRPDRGARAVAPHRGNEQGPRRADRRTLAHLQLSDVAFRRRLHRHLQPARGVDRGELGRHRRDRGRRPRHGARRVHGAVYGARRGHDRAAPGKDPRAGIGGVCGRRSVRTTASPAPSPNTCTWAT